METIVDFIALHTPYAHFWLFGLLLLGGLNIPISEDAILIVGGYLAYTLPIESAVHLYFWLYLGCCLSAWEAFWLGRLLGHRLNHGRFEKRIEKIGRFYHRFGRWAFFIGRFIPFGVRNCLFISSGMSQMPFARFISRDIPACLISSGTLFSLAYCFGKNHQILYQYVQTYERVIGLILLVAFVLIISFRRSKTVAPASSK